MALHHWLQPQAVPHLRQHRLLLCAVLLASALATASRAAAAMLARCRARLAKACDGRGHRRGVAVLLAASHTTGTPHKAVSAHLLSAPPLAAAAVWPSA